MRKVLAFVTGIVGLQGEQVQFNVQFVFDDGQGFFAGVFQATPTVPIGTSDADLTTAIVAAIVSTVNTSTTGAFNNETITTADVGLVNPPHGLGK